MTLPNPLIPGFNPDPSVVLADGVYYLVTSTFEYLPGIPVYRSTDLARWTHIGNVVTRPGQVEDGVDRGVAGRRDADDRRERSVVRQPVGDVARG